MSHSVLDPKVRKKSFGLLLPSALIRPFMSTLILDTTLPFNQSLSLKHSSISYSNKKLIWSFWENNQSTMTVIKLVKFWLDCWTGLKQLSPQKSTSMAVKLKLPEKLTPVWRQLSSNHQLSLHATWDSTLRK